jgi:16S rRNA (uracil1498-N3)-methyltransferase
LELASITLLRTDHSQEPKNSDLGRTIRRLEMKSMTAFKQSQKSWITSVHGPIPFTQWLTECPQIILCDIDGSNSLPPNVLSATSPDLSLAVGPEGGFSQSEIAAMKEKNALLLKLGATRLRARTCPAIAMGALIGMGFQQH